MHHEVRGKGRDAFSLRCDLRHAARSYDRPVCLGGHGVGGVEVHLNSVRDPTDPQNTNIPYVAWAGETVKVTKCLNFDGFDASQLSQFSNLQGTLNISGWKRHGPCWSEHAVLHAVEQPGPHGHRQVVRDRGLCWSGLITSEKPGLATLKLAVNDPGLERSSPTRSPMAARRAVPARLPRHLAAVAGSGHH